jgi:uncharacterized membrane protein
VRAMSQAKQPVTSLAGRYGHPLHPALVSVPIGAWVASFAFDCASHLTDPATLATGSRWLIGLGVLGAVLAALVGVLDLMALPPGTPVFRTALAHLGLALLATTLYAVGFLLRGDPPAAPVPLNQLALSALALASLLGAGFLGGRLAFRYGVRVAAESVQADGYRRLGHRRPQPLDPKETH